MEYLLPCVAIFIVVQEEFPIKPLVDVRSNVIRYIIFAFLKLRQTQVTFTSSNHLYPRFQNIVWQLARPQRNLCTLIDDIKDKGI